MPDETTTEEQSLLSEETTSEETSTEETKTEDKSLLSEETKSEETKEETKTEVEYDLKAPEGFKELDEALAASFVEVAKANNLTPEAAQKLVDMYGNSVNDIYKAQEAQHLDTIKEWKDNTMKDEEIGGVNLQSTVSDAKAALNVFGNTAVLELLEDSGLANHPEVIRMLAKIGKATKDDNFSFGREQNRQEFTPKMLYSNSPELT